MTEDEYMRLVSQANMILKELRLFPAYEFRMFQRANHPEPDHSQLALMILGAQLEASGDFTTSLIIAGEEPKP